MIAFRKEYLPYPEYLGMAALDKRFKKYQRRGDIHFVICNSCFWCASYISTNTLERSFYVSAKCPDCREGNMESIPINQNEIYAFL
jgi:hypothetical protein